jgi:hypothetical protein
MSPHHGSPAANTEGLAKWSHPWAVISCQGHLRGPEPSPNPYRALGAWPHGAIIVRSHAKGLEVETFQTQQRFVLATNNTG